MNKIALIPVFTGTLQDQSVQLCNARDLHTFLQVGRDYSNWIKDRIETYGFIEGEDYSPNLANRSGGTAGKRRIDYHLTLDTAKELSMVENNEQGRMARRYFIAQEKKTLVQIGQAQPAAELPAPHNHKHLTPTQAEQIATLMCTLFPGSLDRHAAWVRFKGNFKINSYRRLPASKFDEAITFIESTDARRRNEFGREAEGRQLVPRNAAPQVDLDALSRQVAEYLQAGQRGETGSVSQESLAEIEALLSETMERFNSLPNNLIYQNLHAVMSLIKKGRKEKGKHTETRYLPASLLKATPQSDWVQLMRESERVCVEIGLAEIERAAGVEADQIHASEIAQFTAQALQKRPEHVADILLVSAWMHAEALVPEAQRDAVRQHWENVAEMVEGVLSHSA
jgi:phage anti-repressor protein